MQGMEEKDQRSPGHYQRDGMENKWHYDNSEHGEKSDKFGGLGVNYHLNHNL